MELKTEGWTAEQWAEAYRWVQRMRTWSTATLTHLTELRADEAPYAQRAAAQMLLNLRLVQPSLFGRL